MHFEIDFVDSVTKLVTKINVKKNYSCSFRKIFGFLKYFVVDGFCRYKNACDCALLGISILIFITASMVYTLMLPHSEVSLNIATISRIYTELVLTNYLSIFSLEHTLRYTPPSFLWSRTCIINHTRSLLSRKYVHQNSVWHFILSSILQPD